MTKEMFRNALASMPACKPVKALQYKLPVVFVPFLCLGLFISQPLVIDLIHIPQVSFYFSNYKAPSEKTALAVTGNAHLLTVGNAKTQTHRAGGVAVYTNAHPPYSVVSDHLYLVNLKIELDYET